MAAPGLFTAQSLHRWGHPLVAALLFTLLNAIKPLHIDDTTYYWFAAQAARHPLDPYGFALMYFQQPIPANQVLAPPVVPYWWSVAIRLFGEQPVLWKLWMFPFSLVLAISLYSLLRRFAAGLEIPLLWMILFSPAFLPAMNLMIDVPALALALGALALFLHAADRDSWREATWAGVLASLCLQTKYTGFTILPVIGLAGALQRKVRLACITISLAILLFAGWECFLLFRYGESHVVYHVWLRRGLGAGKVGLVIPLLMLLGGLVPTLGLLAMVSLHWRATLIGLASAGLVAGYGIILLSPEISRPPLLHFASAPGGVLTVPDAILSAMGLLVLVPLLIAAWSLWRGRISETVDARHRVFLVGWLVVEILGYFVLTPFAAARRVMGIVVAGTVLAGHRAAQKTRGVPPRLAIVRISAATVALGLLFAGVDLEDARAERQALEAAARWIHDQQTDATIWYVGYWGFQYYAERAGMRQIIPAYLPGSSPVPLPAPSFIHRGDWLIAPGPDIPQQIIDLDSSKIDLVHRLEINDWLPFRVATCYYNSATPIRRKEGPRVWVLIARARQDFVAPASPAR